MAEFGSGGGGVLLFDDDLDAGEKPNLPRRDFRRLRVKIDKLVS